MTWGNPPKFSSAPPVNTGKKITPEQLAKSGSEHGEQAALFCWAADNVEQYPQLKWLFAVPNGFYGDSGQKGKMKAEGLRSGVPDVVLPWPIAIRNYELHGCFIEMKIKGGKVSSEQKEWLDYLTKAGYYCKVCYSWQEARDTLIAYLEGKV